MSITWSSAWKQNCCICRQWLAAVWFLKKGLKNGAYVNRPAVRVPHDCKDCTDVPVLFSLLVNTTVQHVVFIFGANSGLSHPRRTAMFVYVSWLYSYCNEVIYWYTEMAVRGIPQSSSVDYCPGIFLFASPEAHESDVFVVRRTRCSVPPQAGWRDKVQCWTGMEPWSLSVSVPPGIPNWRVMVFHKTLLEGWVPYFALHELVGVDPLL